MTFVQLTLRSVSSSGEELRTCGKGGSALPSTGAIILPMAPKLAPNSTSISALITGYRYRMTVSGGDDSPRLCHIAAGTNIYEGKLLQFPFSSEELYDS